MFDAILKSKFYTKCKSATKLTKTRLEMIKRKRNAMQKYLRKDIEDLLKNGLDINAYGRAEGLLVEMNMTACYILVEEFCGCISSHLSLMNKQKDCPEECKQAVPSLMFAAARFADLPELRELRTVFSDRYGKSLEAHVNQEFVEKLKGKPPSKDMKLQLLQEIALGAGLKWDSKALQQKLFSPPPTQEEEARSENTDEDQYKFKKWRTESIRGEEKETKQHNRRSSSSYKNNNDSFPSHRRRESADDRHRHRDHNEIKIEETVAKKAEEKSEEEERPFYYRFIPPPYTKQNPTEEPEPKSVLEPQPSSSSTDTTTSDSAPEAKPVPRSVRRRRSRPPQATSTSETSEAAKAVAEADKDQTMMDKLLAYYSSKKSPFDASDSKGDVGNRTRDGQLGLRSASPPPRSVSPPTARGHVRAISLQPDDQRVHLKLPDYDDFVERLASMKGK